MSTLTTCPDCLDLARRRTTPHGESYTTCGTCRAIVFDAPELESDPPTNRVNWSEAPSAQLTAADLADALRDALSHGVFGLATRDRLASMLIRWDIQQDQPDAGRALIRQLNQDTPGTLRRLMALDENLIVTLAEATIAYRKRFWNTDLTAAQQVAVWRAQAEREPSHAPTS